MNGKLPDPSLLLPEDMGSIPLEGHTQKDTVFGKRVNPLQTPNSLALLSWVCYLPGL